MKNDRLRIAIVASTIFGLIAAYGVYDFLRGQRRAVEALRDSTQDVVVAAGEIPPGKTIDAGMLKIAKYPKASVPRGSFGSPSALIGKTVAHGIVAGEPLLANRLAEGQGALLTAMLAPGTRAIAIKVNEIIGVSGFITPNDRVDVIANLEKPGTEGLDKELTKLVLQDKRVLSVAQTVEKTKDGKPKVASSITLELTPDEAEKLSFATTRGQIVLALRGANDRTTAETKGSTVADFLPAPRPQKLARKGHEVQVYNGSQRSVVTF